ncbi:uncharacterized protein PAC_13515 [Phialocephala subalpina]|uniref:Uncharacterized protein n=1 Tax=Phialocephala subalpina TaxID=576137 RepID=A0A1L7XF31_9HELO|nr:uncharacterized protein PAC_13515 [Phialocephala subalpina]
MAPLQFLLAILACVSLTPCAVLAQSSSVSPSSTIASGTSSTPPTTSIPSTPAPSSSASTGTAASGSTSTTGTSVSTASSNYSAAPDVLLNVPQLSVGRIELDVDNLQADINLNAQVANLVTINAGVQVSVQKINITISDVEAQLELIVRLGHLVDIVQRVFESLDLNPLLITALNDVTSIVDTVVGAVDGLLGSITQGGTILNFLIDSLGNIVQSVTNTAGEVVDTIVGNYLNNMTFTGVTQNLGNGLTQKQYSYGPLNALVNIVFNTLGQIVGQPSVVKQTATSTASTATSTGAAGATSTSAAPSSTGSS